MTIVDSRLATPRGDPVLGMLRHVSRDRLGLMSCLAREYGDAVRFRMGPKTLYFFNHPDHARHVLSDNPANYRRGIGLIHARRALGDGLLTTDGEQWRAQRRAVAPAFRRERVAQAARVIVEEAEQLVARWRELAGATVDVVEEVTGLTMRVLGRALLHTNLSGFEGVGRAFDAVQDQAMFEMVTLNVVPPWLPLARQRRFRRARRELAAMVDRLAGQAGTGDAGAPPADDLLSRLVATTGGGRQLRDELVTLLLAGHETTASTLGWVWHLVSTHPEVFARLHAEATEVLGDRQPEYEDLRRLRYTTTVIEEAIRLYPPVWILPRRAVAADEIGGVPLPAGADVMICPYTLHRHPGFWEQPDRFHPDRFQVADRHRYSYLPFGAGPRVCVGSNLGMLEATLVIAIVARELRLQPVRGHLVVPEPRLSLRVKGGLPMTIHRAG